MTSLPKLILVSVECASFSAFSRRSRCDLNGKRMVQAKIYAGQLVVVFGVVVTWTWSAQQWTASAGEYLGHISGPAVDVNAPATGIYLRGGCRACAFGLSCAPRMGRGAQVIIKAVKSTFAAARSASEMGSML
jgi:hypothetical protein